MWHHPIVTSILIPAAFGFCGGLVSYIVGSYKERQQRLEARISETISSLQAEAHSVCANVIAQVTAAPTNKPGLLELRKRIELAFIESFTRTKTLNLYLPSIEAEKV